MESGISLPAEFIGDPACVVVIVRVITISVVIQ